MLVIQHEQKLLYEILRVLLPQNPILGNTV